MIGHKHSAEAKYKISVALKGKKSALKGKTYEEAYGKEKADLLKQERSEAMKNRKSPTKGKTYEEIHGVEKAAALRKQRGSYPHRTGPSTMRYLCDICGKEMSAKGAGLHKRWHISGRDQRHKCGNPSCDNLAVFDRECCSVRCGAVLNAQRVGKDAMSERKRKSLQENPDSHPSRLTGGMGKSKTRASFPQMKLLEIIRQYVPEAELNFPVNTGATMRYLDVAIVDLKIDFEYDGEYWHAMRQDTDRQRDIELQKCGWKVVRLNKKSDFKQCVLDAIKSATGGI